MSRENWAYDICANDVMGDPIGGYYCCTHARYRGFFKDRPAAPTLYMYSTLEQGISLRVSYLLNNKVRINGQ